MPYLFFCARKSFCHMLTLRLEPKHAGSSCAAKNYEA